MLVFARGERSIHIFLRHRITAIPHATSRQLQKGDWCEQTQQDCFTAMHFREWETPLMMLNLFLWRIVDGERSLVKYHLRPAPCWWPWCSIQTGRRRAQCRRVISAGNRACGKHVLTFIFLYQCLIEMIITVHRIGFLVSSVGDWDGRKRKASWILTSAFWCPGTMKLPWDYFSSIGGRWAL